MSGNNVEHLIGRPLVPFFASSPEGGGKEATAPAERRTRKQKRKERKMAQQAPLIIAEVPGATSMSQLRWVCQDFMASLIQGGIGT